MLHLGERRFDFVQQPGRDFFRGLASDVRPDFRKIGFRRFG
jgi:hypothetical protein